MTTIDAICLDGEIEGAVNLRDLGGYRAGALRVRRGRLFRSGATHRIGEAGLRALAERWGVRTAIDLRSERELREGTAAWAAAGIEHVHAPVFADLDTSPDSEAMAQRFAGMRSGDYDWSAAYMAMARDGASAYRALFEHLARPRALPALFHCAGGRDRTGVAAALILATLGVEAESVAQDYALTGRFLQPHAHLFSAQAARFGMTAAEMAAMLLATSAESMLGFLTWLEGEYGGADAYLRAIGVSDAALASVRDALLEPAA